MPRPQLTKTIDPAEFDSYYWYKEELMDFARRLGVKASGGKFEIHDRISDYLRGVVQGVSVVKAKTSKFDWTNKLLTKDTVITDSYKNSQNVRKFFKEYVGESFKFSITLMDWMQGHIGSTLGDAVQVYPELMQNRKRQEIRTHNQFNLYLREYFADNPEGTKEEATATWLKKIEIPRPGSKGHGIRYDRQDLLL